MPIFRMVTLSLTQMQEGDAGVVVHSPCASSHGARLAELGLTEGEFVQLLRRGSPMVLQIGATRLSLRAEEATHVSVLCVR